MFRTCAAVLAICGLVSACQLNSKVNVPTKLVVDVDAELPVRLRSQELHVLVTVMSDDAGAPQQPQFERVFQPSTAADGGWPIRIELTPEPAQTQRKFDLTATAYDGSRAYVAEARIQSSYVANEVHYVRLMLSAACMSVKCTAAQSCSAGTCAPAWREPGQLPLFWPTAGAGALSDAVRADAGQGPLQNVGVGVPMAKPDPCLTNNGGCDALVSCQNVAGKAICGDCPAGYEDLAHDGTKCQDIDECKLTAAGGCDADHGRCTNTPGGHDCSCADGYHGDGIHCTLNVQCTSDAACSPQAQCRPASGGQNVCVCKAGFEGDGVQCKDVDECVRKLDQCRSHAQCQNTEGAFTCPCAKGFLDSSGACVDVDECTAKLDDCDDDPDACVNTPGGFTCRCPAGFSGDGRGSSGCADVDECAGGNVCDAKRACVNTPGGVMCGACDKGYQASGTRACTDVDECVTDNGGCDSRRACINLPGSSMCGACRDGFVASGATGCASANECGQNNGGCDSKRRCVENPGGGHSCGACDPGWLPSGATACVDIDECQVANGGCDLNRTCVNTQGSYMCGDCKQGFTPNGALGCIDIDECATNNGGCGAHRKCTNSDGSRQCGDCDPGWMLGANGCIDADECSVNNGGCLHRKCDNSDGSFSCGECDAGFPIKKSTTECAADPCANLMCANGTCMVTNNVPTCTCDTAHVLDQGRCVLPCNVLNACPEHVLCTDNGTRAVCGECQDGWVKGQGNKCEPDPCKPNPCGAGSTCQLGNNGRYSCNCPAGQEEQSGRCVEMVDPCTAANCPAGTTCVKQGQGARCQCPDKSEPVGGLCITSMAGGPAMPMPMPPGNGDGNKDN